MTEPRVIAIDWSGAKAPAGQKKGICVAIAQSDEITSSAGRTRIETIELVEGMTGPLVVGFDFSFGLPKWFATEHGCTTIDDVWALAARNGEDWLGPPPQPPFWNARREVPIERSFRRCEEALRPAKSVFQLVGNGQVGPGSVRGMPLLSRLRERGFAIWPFDAPGDRTVMEIYPTALRPLAPTRFAERDFSTKDERDAVLSAAVMWERRASFAALKPATDPVTLIEGDVWMPSSSP